MATPGGLLWVLGGQGHKLSSSWVFPPQMERRLRGVERAPVTLHWGTTHYLQGIAPPGVGQDGGSENGHKRVGKECLTGKRDQEGLRLGYHSGGMTLDSKFLGTGGGGVVGRGYEGDSSAPHFTLPHILPRGGSRLRFVPGGR